MKFLIGLLFLLNAAVSSAASDFSLRAKPHQISGALGVPPTLVHVSDGSETKSPVSPVLQAGFLLKHSRIITQHQVALAEGDGFSPQLRPLLVYLHQYRL